MKQRNVSKIMEKSNVSKWRSFNKQASIWIRLIGAGLSVAVGITAIILTIAVGPVVPITIFGLLSHVVASFGGPAVIAAFTAQTVFSTIWFGFLSTLIGLVVTAAVEIATGVLSALGFGLKFAVESIKNFFGSSADVSENVEQKDEKIVEEKDNIQESSVHSETKVEKIVEEKDNIKELSVYSELKVEKIVEEQSQDEQDQLSYLPQKEWVPGNQLSTQTQKGQGESQKQPTKEQPEYQEISSNTSN